MKVDKLSVNIYDTRAEMGAAAAKDIKNKFCELLETKPQINVIFAAAPNYDLHFVKIVPMQRRSALEGALSCHDVALEKGLASVDEDRLC